MAHEYDEVAGGYRLICEATGQRSEVVSTSESAVRGMEWYADTHEARVLFLQRQRDRYLALMPQSGWPLDDVQSMQETLRWDVMPDGTTVVDTRLDVVSRRRVAIQASALTFPADGVSVCRCVFAGLASPVQCLLDPGGVVTISPDDPVLEITSDSPQTIIIRLQDADHVMAPLVVEAV